LSLKLKELFQEPTKLIITLMDLSHTVAGGTVPEALLQVCEADGQVLEAGSTVPIPRGTFPAAGEAVFDAGAAVPVAVGVRPQPVADAQYK
jgi:hypothetical protein